MKKNLLLASLVLSFLLLPSCANSTWDNIEKVAANAAILSGETKEGLAAAKEKIVALEAKLEAVQHANMSKIEAAIGFPLDKDGDGDITVEEGKAAYAAMLKSTEGRRLLFDPEVLLTILTMIAGLGAAKPLAKKALAATHLTGRNLVNGHGAAGNGNGATS